MAHEYKRRNSASRVHSTIARAMSVPGETPTWQVWAQTFGIQIKPKKDAGDEVVDQLQLIRIELDLIEANAGLKSLTESIWKPSLDKVRQAVHVFRLQATWKDNYQYLGSDVLNILLLCNELIADDETPVPADRLVELQELADRLQAAAKTLADSGLRTFLTRHADLIKRAISRYPIAGAAALYEAEASGFGERIFASAAIEANAGRDEVKQFKTLWAKFEAAASIPHGADISAAVSDALKAIGHERALSKLPHFPQRPPAVEAPAPPQLAGPSTNTPLLAAPAGPTA